jgi:two-component system response regulator NreC
MKTLKTVRVLISDNHAIIRAGLRLILQTDGDFEIVGEADSSEESIDLAAQLHPDLIIMDISVPGMGGLSAIPRLREVAPEAKVLILTIHDDEDYFFQALRAGASGYVLKSASGNELLAALHLVTHGGVPVPSRLAPHLLHDFWARAQDEEVPGFQQLSTREGEVLRLIARGRTNREIAEQLSLSVRTVERHRSSIMNKIGLQNRAELVVYAVRQGLLGGDDIK